MKFKDTVTGALVATDNPFVVEQYEKHPERFEKVEEKAPKKTKK